MKSAKLITAFTFLWSGLLLGISFIEAPLKFQAPNVTTEIALGIGRIVFTAMNRTEWIFAIGIIICLGLTHASWRTWLIFALPIGILLVQTFILLPPLNDRTDRLLAGGELEPSKRHLYYIVTEVIKFIALLVAGFWFSGPTNSSHRQSSETS